MEKNQNKKTGLLRSFIGEATPAKASGVTYTLTAILSVVVAFTFLIGIAVLGFMKDGYETSDWYLYCSYLLTPLTFLLVALYVMRWTRSSISKEFRRQICPARYFLIAVLLQCGLLSLSQLNSLFLEWLGNFGYQDVPINIPSLDGFGFIGVLFTVAVLPAVFEEIIFRGLLLNGMRCFGMVGAVLLNGALFALYHQNPAQTIYQFCCGAAFALIALRAGSILPTIFSHFLNNALIITLMKLNSSDLTGTAMTVVLIVSAVCLVGALFWLIFFDKGRNDGTAEIKKNDGKTEKKYFFQYAAIGVALYALTWISVLLKGV